MWTILDKNILSDEKPVAKFKNNKGITIFYVYSTKHGYNAISQINCIKSEYISYSDCRKMNTKEEENQETHEVLASALRHACEYFEEKYSEQVNTIKEQI